MKYLKLFENWDLNETQKEELKKNYEKYVMDKDYIPNLVKEKIKESFGYNSQIIKQIKFDFRWESIPFNKLSETRDKIRFSSMHHNGPNISDVQWTNVCVVGVLRIIADQFFTQTNDGYPSDETAVINERIDSALAKATEELKSKFLLPPKSSLDNSGSHGPNCFVRDKKDGLIAPRSMKPNPFASPYDKQIIFTTWLVLDKSYCEI